MKTQILFERNIKEAAELLKKGEVVAFPTETVYGLGALLFQEAAVKKIFIAKGRPSDNPLIAHVSSLEQCEEIAANLPPLFFTLMNAFAPGPLTLVVTKHPKISPLVSGGLDTIAIRMPSHPVASMLIKAVGEPLVAPSANTSGCPSSTEVTHVLTDLEGKIAAVIDGGKCQIGIESTVVDLVSFDRPTLLRPGSITKEQIEKKIGIKIATYSHGPKSSPGMRYRHYAPKMPVKLFSSEEELELYSKGKHCLILSTKKLKGSFFPLKSKTLYSSLRLADQLSVEEVLIFIGSCKEEALLNRLEKIAEEV